MLSTVYSKGLFTDFPIYTRPVWSGSVTQIEIPPLIDFSFYPLGDTFIVRPFLDF